MQTILIIEDDQTIRTLSVNVTRLRNKLEGLGMPDIFKTRRGMRYQL